MTIRRFNLLFASIFILLMAGMASAYYRLYVFELFFGLTAVIGGLIFASYQEVRNQSQKLHEALTVSTNLDGILRTILDINQSLLSISDSDTAIQVCCQRLSAHSGYGLCWIALKIDDNLEIRGCSDDSVGVLHRGMKIEMDESSSFAPSVLAYNEKAQVVLDHLEKHESLATWCFIAKEKEYGSLIALPLIAQNNKVPFGVLTLYAQSSGGFASKEIEMLVELAGDIGFALDSHLQRRELARHVGIDVVSGLPNRVSLIDYLFLHRVSALAILNIDRFSDINDVYGVAIGDQVLAGYGHWLLNKVEKTTGVFVYKLGSDEYALVFDETHTRDDSFSFLEYLIDKTEESSFVIEGIEVILSITVGFDPQSEKLIENATRALKQAKLRREKISIYTPQIGAKKEHANNIEWYKEIREALEDDRIVPYFQPIVDNKTHKIIKYEALIRLIKRDGSIVSPYHFLEIAQKIRLYPALTKRMLDRVVEEFEMSAVPVSINLSTEDLLNRELADYIEELLSRYKIGGRIIFEVLESEGISNYAEVSTFIDRFKAIGCRFAIDDFGSGYSNFDHLLRLNVDTLKIDGSLIKNLPHDHNAQIIVRHICSFAHEMGFSTVAEFVADEAIYRKVLELGIDASQGYYFYEPLQKPIIDYKE
jgi:diguanylate cyclase (GGDEF)-like protein